MITYRNLICLTLIPSILLLIPSLTDNYILGQNQGNVSGVQTTQMYHYFNYDDNVSMNYPSTWSVNETDITPEDRVNLIAEFVSPFETYNDTYIEYVTINRGDGIFSEVDLNEYLAEAINTYKDIANNFTLIESSTSDSLSSQPAYSLTFTEVLSGEDGQEPITLKNFETGILLNNTAYFVTYVGQEEKFDRYFPVVEQMINSFKLLLPASYDEGLAPPLVTNLNTSTIGLEESITGTNKTTTSASTGSNSTSSNPIVPNNLTNSQIGQKNNTTEPASKGGEANLSTGGQLHESSQINDTRGSENAQLKKDKAVDIQIKAAEKNGFFGTVNFVPNEIVVDIGTIVVWTNNHSSVHTVTSINNNTFVNNGITTGRVGIPLFDSDYMNTGDKFSYNFTQPGRFDYFDKNDASLKGVVFVKQAPSLINRTLSLLDNEDTSPANVNPLSNDFNSSNNKSGMLDNLKDVNNSSAKSNNGTLAQLIQSLRQIINR